MSLSTRLLRVLFLSSLAFGIAGAFVGLAYNGLIIRETAQHRVDHEAMTAASSIQRHYQFGDVIGLKTTLRSIAHANGWCNGEFRDQEQNLVWEYQADADRQCKTVFAWLFGGDLIRKEQEVPLGEAIGRLVFDVPPVSDSRLVASTLVSFFGPFALFWLMFMFLMRWIFKRTLAPLRLLSDSIKNYADELAFTLPEVAARDELAQTQALFEELVLRWRDALEKSKIAEADKATARVSAQVAHDIRSPLTALNVIQEKLAGVPGDQRQLLKSAVRRIAEIVENLRSPRAGGSAREMTAAEPGLQDERRKDVHDVLLMPLLQSQIREKRLEGSLTDDALSFESHPGCAFDVVTANSAELRRVISNLINNSLEAVPPDRRALCAVHLTRDGSRSLITVRDNGRGIPPEWVPRLGERGLTLGKSGGSGLGLWYAFAKVREWGGEIGIESDSSGTKVVLAFVRPPDTPSWLAAGIDLTEVRYVVVIDDDPSIHEVWRQRLISFGLPVFGVRGEMEFLRRYAMQSVREGHFLVDYDLGGTEASGLDIIRRFPEIAPRATLVTSSFDEPTVQRGAQELGVRILPKDLLDAVQIIREQSRDSYNLDVSLRDFTGQARDTEY